MSTPRHLAAGAVAVAVLTTAGCAGDSDSTSDFKLKTANTAQALAGVVGTTEILVRQGDAGRLTGPFVSEAVDESDKDAKNILLGYRAVVPPNAESDQLATRMVALGQQVESVLADLLADARRGQLDQLGTDGQPLESLRQQLQELESLGAGLP